MENYTLEEIQEWLKDMYNSYGDESLLEAFQEEFVKIQDKIYYTHLGTNIMIGVVCFLIVMTLAMYISTHKKLTNNNRKLRKLKNRLLRELKGDLENSEE